MKVFVLYGRCDTTLISPRVFNDFQTARFIMENQIQDLLNDILDPEDALEEIIDGETGFITYSTSFESKYAEINKDYAVVRDDNYWTEYEILEVEVE